MKWSYTELEDFKKKKEKKENDYFGLLETGEI